MREQYDTTGLHSVELEAPDLPRSMWRGRHWLEQLRQEEIPAEIPAEEDRRWWARLPTPPKHALSSPLLDDVHRRRARKAGVEVGHVDLVAVAQRDRWRCGICGKKVSPRAEGARSASLDHIVPLSQGGGHVMTNAQLCHLVCNTRKNAHDYLPSQMSLFP